METFVEEIYSVIQSLKKSEHLFTDPLHKYRTELDPFIFKALDQLYGKKLDDFWSTAEIPRESDKAICIVERRCHPNLKFCLQNAAYFARGYSIHIFCSEANIEYIKLICEKQIRNLHIYPILPDIGTPEQGKKEYNDLLMSSDFWDTFTEEHIITIETDTYFLRPIPASIYTFDYVGSKWASKPNEPGGGGLTYRKSSVIKKVLSLDISGHTMQDTYMSHGIQLLNKKYPTLEEASYYFTEGYFSLHCIGTHQWWTFIYGLTEGYLVKLIQFYLTLDI